MCTCNTEDSVVKYGVQFICMVSANRVWVHILYLYVSHTNANPMHPMQGLALVTTLLSVYPDGDLDLD